MTMMTIIVFFSGGAFFGYILSCSGATLPELHAQLFLFQNFHLLGVMGTAVIVNLIGYFVLKSTNIKCLFENKALPSPKKPYQIGLFQGALFFGIGWGLTGSCPGVVLVMVGEGKISALFTILGIIIGTYLYGHRRERNK